MTVIQDKIKGFNRAELFDGKALNDEISFYSELQTDIKKHPFYYKFRKKLSDLYHNSYKEDMFVNAYLGKNLPSIEICETIFSNLYDVFDSQNANINIEVDGENSTDLKNQLNEYYNWFKSDGYANAKTLFNSFLVVDIEDGKPYYYNVAPEYVYYYDLEDDGTIEEIIFSFDQKEFYYYTNEFYSKYEKQGNDYILEYENIHNIGKCPVSIFLFEKFNNSSNILRKNILTAQSDDLHKYVVKATELYMTEFASSNYIKAMPEKGCGYEISNEICKGGRIYATNPDLNKGDMPVMLDDGTQKICPVCGYNRHIGTGATITIDYQAAAESNINVSDIIKYFAPPLEGTNYQKTRLQELKTSIIESSVGQIKRDFKEARNETDVKSDYESRTKILTQFGYFYSKTIEFGLEIVARILYKNKFKFINVFLGNKFYLLTKEELIAEKEKATNPVERSEIELKILKLDFKHDPNKLNAILRIYEQLPYSGITDIDFFELIKLGKVSNFDIELRTNINYYIAEFERTTKNNPAILDYNYINKIITQLVNEKLNKNGISTNTTGETV